jgi:hypothetical protein
MFIHDQMFNWQELQWLYVGTTLTYHDMFFTWVEA